MTKKEYETKINQYFDLQAKKCQEWAAYAMEKEKASKFQSEKDHYRNQAWHYGINRTAMLDDMRKDLLSL